MIYPKSFNNLLDCFKKLPGVGEKSAERFVYSIDSLTEVEVKKMSKSLIDFKNNIKKCKICGHYSDNEICTVCQDTSRDNNMICVVSDSKSVFAVEKAGNYNGVYHVLNGLISPIEGINPDDINIFELVEHRANDNVEIIIALSPSIEGETTSLYIQKLLESKKVKVSRLSYGIPLGTDIEYLDSVMISKAFEDRKKIS